MVRGVSTVSLGLFAVAVGSGAAQNGPRGGDGTIYMATYDKSIHVIDEATLEVVGRIPTESGIPVSLILSESRERFYVRDATTEHVEVIDIGARRSVGRFTLTSGNTRVRIRSMSVDPHERFAILLIKTYTKLSDRFEIGPPRLVRFDLETRAVTDTIPWPENEEREFARILFSPDGSLLYFFTPDDILIYDTSSFEEVDRWDLSQPLEEGLGRLSFGFPTNLYEEPGFYTGLFRVTDPVQNRRMMGVARVNLTQKSVDFYTLGPSESVGFSLAPDRKKAYGLHQEVGNYQFWTFDLEQRRVVNKTEFRGRPRMALMPSSNGELLYILNAGHTIDVYEASTYRHLRTVELEADMTSFVLLPPGT